MPTDDIRPDFGHVLGLALFALGLLFGYATDEGLLALLLLAIGAGLCLRTHTPGIHGPGQDG